MKNNLMILCAIFIVAMFVTACSQTPQAPAANSPATGQNPANQNTNPANTNPSQNTGSQLADNSTNQTQATTQTTQTGTVKELDIEAYKFGFRVTNSVQINKGDTVHLVVTSTDGIHGFALPDFNVDLKPIAQGQTLETTFVADKAGTFTYFCDVPCGPGHRSMRGTLTVNA